jgi:hypothetical protein
MCDVLFSYKVFLDAGAVKPTVIEALGEIPELAMSAR